MQPPQDPLFQLLRTTMHERGWGVTRLAEHCGVSTALASRWVMEDPRKRIRPSPASCHRIAEAIGADPDYVLELAGHRQPRAPVAEPGTNPPYSVPARVQLDNLGRAYERFVAAIAPVVGDDVAHDLFWRPILATAKLRQETVDAIQRAVKVASAGADNPADNPRPARLSAARGAEREPESTAFRFAPLAFAVAS